MSCDFGVTNSLSFIMDEFTYTTSTPVASYGVNVKV